MNAFVRESLRLVGFFGAFAILGGVIYAIGALDGWWIDTDPYDTASWKPDQNK